jgi:TRAP-type uncharacterized transport system fused permease subunit
VFVLDPLGVGLLLQIPKGGSVYDIVWITGQTTLGLAALAAGAQGWALRQATTVERVFLLTGGLLMCFPGLSEALAEAIIGRDIAHTATFGLLIAGAVLLKQWMLPVPPEIQATRRQEGGQ